MIKMSSFWMKLDEYLDEGLQDAGSRFTARIKKIKSGVEEIH